MAQASEGDAVHTLVSYIQHLGGAPVAPTDIAWATDLPSGNALIEWLAAQYCSPATVRARAEYAEEEAALLERETKALRHRLQQATAVSRKVSQTIKSSRPPSAASTATATTPGAPAELSLRTDTSIAQASSTATHLLDVLGANPGPTHTAQPNATAHQTESESDLGIYARSLAALAARRTEITSRAERRLRAVDDAECALPHPAELQREAARLQAQLRPGDKVAFAPERLLARARDAELATLCRRLADEDKAEVLRLLLDASDNADELAPDELAPDVASELGRAWSCDHAAVLAAREEALDQTTAMLTQHLDLPLAALHARASAARSARDDAEALIGALVEELAEGRRRAHLLAAALTGLLKSRPDLRARDAAPLVLLDAADLAAELAALSARLQAAACAEDAWLSAVPARLSALVERRAPLLAALYAHAPVNTSPPCAPAPARAALEGAARGRADGLGQAVVRLQQASGLSGKDTRRLDAFVERFAH
ncbi:hypothetical protein B0H21DRAFT_713039 [Amylocystis lapponica]|nr:hypothetical protein B0H21DRAFT_713039 [Amylocystis lapponica]